MAQHFWTPNPADLNGPPSDLTVIYGNVSLTVLQDGNGDYYVHVDNSTASRKAITIDSIGTTSLANVGDVEMYTETTHDGGSNQRNPDIRHLVRFTGTVGGDSTCRINGIEYTSGVDAVRLSKIVNGTFSQDSDVPITLSFTGGVTIHQRTQSIGSNQKAKYWLNADPEPGTWVNEVTEGSVTQSGAIGLFNYDSDDFRLYKIGVGTNGDPAPTSAPTGGGTAQDTTVINIDQATQTELVPVDQLAALTGVQVQQWLDTQTAGVAADFGLTLDDLSQDTSVTLLTISTDAIATINVVAAEQLHSASTANVSELNSVASIIVQQALGIELVTPAQVGSITGIPGQSLAQGNTAGVITDISTNVVSADQLTQAQIINLLDGAGLSVVTVEQETDLASGNVSILNTVAVVSSEQANAGETIVTGVAAVLSVLNAEQITESEVADILGSAMLVNPRSLRVKRTTIGYTVNRKTSAFRVTLKTT